MEQPIIRIKKHADTTTNKMIIPKVAIEKWGNDYYLEIYEDKIILIPINQSKGE